MVRLQKFRFLLVAFLVQALLMLPVQNAFANASLSIPSAQRSSLSASSSQASVGEMLPVSVQLLDRFSQPVVGHEIELMTSDSSVSVFSSDHFTDSSGFADFMLLASDVGSVSIAAIDLSTGMMLAQQQQVRFVDEQAVFLSNESGPLSSFRIEGLEDTVEVGETLTVSVTAVDASGLTVGDYTGTLRFSSSDSQAKLPNDYTFRAEDAGRHTFSLGVQFSSTGTHSLRVTDLDQFTIFGESDVDVALDSNYVASSGGSAPSPTVDSSPEAADFVLISPASGTFSNNSLEVQGQAEYGYSALVFLNDEEVGRTNVEFDNSSFNYELKNLSDGDYEVYVEIVELGSGEAGEEEVLAVIETSDVVQLTIDTSAPELVEISFNDELFAAGELKEVTVLSESSLDEAYLVLDGELYELSESTTPGKYTAQLPLPLESGDYSLDVLLVDGLGNEVEHRDAIMFSVQDLSASDSEDLESVVSEGSSSETSDEDLKVDSIAQVEALMVRSDEERVALSWEQPDSPEPIAYYRVHYGPSENALFAISDTLDSSTSWMVKDLIGEEIYYFAVSAVDILGQEGPKSAAAIAVPLARINPAGAGDTSIDGNVPLGQSIPAMSQDSYTPPSTPDSGAGTGVMLGLSALGGIGYALGRKRDKILGN